MSYGMNRASSLYQQTRAQGSVEGADRHQLISMLLDGLVDRINQARGNIHHGDVAAKGRSFSKAIAIVGELRSSLDHEVQPELTARLDALYDYITRRLLHAQLNDDTAALDECVRLVAPVREGWQGIRSAYLAEAAQGKGA
jgi:flagellar protein FliS